MKYIQFYQKSAISDDIIEATGDRSVIILGGHHRGATTQDRDIALEEGIKRGYIGFQIFHGTSFTHSFPISSDVEKLPKILKGTFIFGDWHFWTGTLNTAMLSNEGEKNLQSFPNTDACINWLFLNGSPDAARAFNKHLKGEKYETQ